MVTDETDGGRGIERECNIPARSDSLDITYMRHHFAVEGTVTMEYSEKYPQLRTVK